MGSNLQRNLEVQNYIMSAREMKRDCKIFCGGLDRDRPVHEDDVRYAFKKYGRIRSIWVARRPPGFCYVEMESPRDAEEACRKLDGSKICGFYAKVSMSDQRKEGVARGGIARSRSRSRGRDRRSRSRDRRSKDRQERPRSYDRNRDRSRERRRSRSNGRRNSRSRR